MAFMGYLFKPMTVRTPDGDPYLKRFFILRTRWLQIYVHHLYRSDPDPDMHDHPWSFLSCILWGGYVEHTPEGAFKRHAPQILYRPVGSPHRLELTRPAWTLVFVGPERRDWGFVTDKGWVSHHDHRGPQATNPAKT